ncbi:uncharacterized protein [Primulina huaijiensis]|uniref:uncharacterized protein n=1 Tax=Primulina huaijiensis TaxID=1492673 RepID=UPI003CC74CEF
MDNDRNWMYRRLENGFLTNEYCVGVESFVTFALGHPECLLNGNIRCPCNQKKCQNKIYLDEDTVKIHLGRYGFVPNYYNWFFHGEEYIQPFYPNLNMDAPSSSSYRVAPRIAQTTFPDFFDTIEENVNEMWLARAVKNKDNRNSEPARTRTETTKHIAGSKTYNGHCQKLREQHHRDPTSWELYVHTHRHVDGSFVDERSQLVDQAMQAYMNESLTPLDDGTTPSPPTSGEVNSMFSMVVGGPKKRRMYGCGSMASTIYQDEIA